MKDEDIKFYGSYYTMLSNASTKVEDILLEQCEDKMEHFKTRIKSKQSTLAKLSRKNLEHTVENAITNLNDIIGIRVICRFLNDVYDVAKIIKTSTLWDCVAIKDYIVHPKPNGYRCYHIILEIDIDDIKVPVEVQIRTISQDTWACLEHKMKYKKSIGHVELIQGELKRLADEMASCDVCMQTLRELICEIDD